MTSEAQLAATAGNGGTPPMADGTMQAIVQDGYGSADVLRLASIVRPEIADNEVLVRVRAAGVHIGDWHLMMGQPYLMRIMGFGFRAPKSRVRGLDLAGTIEATGKDVTRFRVGEEVFGSGEGSFAEYAPAPEDTLAQKPANLTFDQAAAVPTSACTALQALRAGQDRIRAAGPDHRGVRRRGDVRGADRQIVRS